MTEIIVVGFPKSGNTWLSCLLSDALNWPVRAIGSARPLAERGDDRADGNVIRQLHVMPHDNIDDSRYPGFVASQWSINMKYYSDQRLVHIIRTVQMETEGHRIVDRDADVIIAGDLAEFGVTTSICLSSWDAIGSLDIAVKIYPSSSAHDSLIRCYQLRYVSKTVLGPSKEDFEQVMRACLEDMQRQMASDEELKRLLAGNLR